METVYVAPHVLSLEPLNGFCKILYRICTVCCLTNLILIRVGSGLHNTYFQCAAHRTLFSETKLKDSSYKQLLRAVDINVVKIYNVY